MTTAYRSILFIKELNYSSTTSSCYHCVPLSPAAAFLLGPWEPLTLRVPPYRPRGQQASCPLSPFFPAVLGVPRGWGP